MITRAKPVQGAKPTVVQETPGAYGPIIRLILDLPSLTTLHVGHGQRGVVALL